jgi:threonine aldolase
MRRAMAEAEVGDDVFGEDRTVIRLQQRAAELLGKEAALFVPSGTMGNQIAVKLQTLPGDEVVAEARSHVFNYELAMVAVFSGCLVRPVTASGGLLTWALVQSAVNPPVYYRSRTRLLVLENTHNMWGGTVMDEETTSSVARAAHEHGLAVHLDGARLFNAAAALRTDPARLCRDCDTVMVCLSKGLCAPVGSLLAGRQELIEEARKVRKMLGGGMRQVGVLAAAGLVALERMRERLEEDHANARLLAEGLAEMEPFEVDLSRVRTNIVIAGLRGMTSSALVAALEAEGVRSVPTGPREIRFVTHHDVDRRQIVDALAIIRRTVASCVQVQS